MCCLDSIQVACENRVFFVACICLHHIRQKRPLHDWGLFDDSFVIEASEVPGIPLDHIWMIRCDLQWLTPADKLNRHCTADGIFLNEVLSLKMLAAHTQSGVRCQSWTCKDLWLLGQLVCWTGTWIRGVLSLGDPYPSVRGDDPGVFTAGYAELA